MATDQRTLSTARAAASRHPVAIGWAIHCFTGLGALCGMFGLMAVANGNKRETILWLMVALVLDGVDGSAARAYAVHETVPRIDGNILDLIIDYVTCIVIPVLFMHRFEMLPGGWSLFIGSFVLFMSALWMARTDQMTGDHFFNGFPCEWNTIVPTLFLLQAPTWITAVACVLLAITQLTNWKFVHPMQVRRFRPVTITVTVLWLGTVLAMTADWPNHNEAAKYLLAACPLYIVGVGVWRTIGPGAVERQPTPVT